MCACLAAAGRLVPSPAEGGWIPSTWSEFWWEVLYGSVVCVWLWFAVVSRVWYRAPAAPRLARVSIETTPRKQVMQQDYLDFLVWDAGNFLTFFVVGSCVRGGGGGAPSLVGENSSTL